MPTPEALPFSPAVVIEFGSRVGTHYRIASVRHAAQCLVSGWPEKRRGKAYSAALNACLAALEGTSDAESARLAFIAAAREVGIYAREGSGRR
jgi:hypothetical protein